MDALSELIVLKELATKLEVSERTLQGWCREGRLPAAKIAGKWVLHRSLLLDHVRRESLPSATSQEDLEEALR